MSRSIVITGIIVSVVVVTIIIVIKRLKTPRYYSTAQGAYKFVLKTGNVTGAIETSQLPSMDSCKQTCLTYATTNSCNMWTYDTKTQTCTIMVHPDRYDQVPDPDSVSGTIYKQKPFLQ